MNGVHAHLLVVIKQQILCAQREPEPHHLLVSDLLKLPLSCFRLVISFELLEVGDELIRLLIRLEQ